MRSPRENHPRRRGGKKFSTGKRPRDTEAANPAPRLDHEPRTRGPARGRELPPRLQEVLTLLLEGQSMKQMARRLKIAQNTVHIYTTEIYRRFDVHGHVELLAYFLREARRRGDAQGGREDEE